MSPFIDISIAPSYGDKTAVILWKLPSFYMTGQVYVFKSQTGMTPWTLLTPSGVSAAEEFWKDDDFMVSNRTDVVHYRLLLVHDGKEYDSAKIGVYDKLTPREMGGVKQILWQEYLRMSRGNGVQVLVCKPLQNGVPCGNYDEDTGQRFSGDCPDDPSDDECYGERFKGGFNKPVQTWMEFVKVGPITILDKEEGLGTVDDHEDQVRMLAFPHLKRGDMVIWPAVDKRYKIKVVQISAFRGIIPISYTGSIELLARNHPAYKFPVPDLNPDPLPHQT